MKVFIKGLMKWLKKMLNQLFEILQFWKTLADDTPDWKGVPKRGVPKGRNYRAVRTS